ncbi:cob(I)yrinic acid a,c-diamide adenosyltransferase [Caldovatus aquaticus]|uniref:Corrinoid adenosyltransferase n=1 Tax=Caldovatus aquaticus TaxID=2865671 RepID=A0ABS7F2Q9_9PROT|nr:cob(I)yrinic acid a,c-diamide adenosyltransferase [Caldovatus aquaticus]MBW8269900.1 cob(I)yrinic acid a,c-diamide adenosyltransferase [Caldovatus aquaticus]
MVRLDRITTRGGDRGETSLGEGSRVRKDAARIEAIGAVDEANAALGLLRAQIAAAGGDAGAEAMLARLQNDLFDLGADLSVPGTEARDARTGRTRLRLTEAHCARLEAEIAAMNATLPPLASFVLPGGSLAAAQAHVARTVVRRAERRVVRLAAEEPVNPEVLRYLNRLSDHLFVLARRLNQNGAADLLWVPGGGAGDGQRS